MKVYILIGAAAGGSLYAWLNYLGQSLGAWQ